MGGPFSNKADGYNGVFVDGLIHGLITQAFMELWVFMGNWITGNLWSLNFLFMGSLGYFTSIVWTYGPLLTTGFWAHFVVNLRVPPPMPRLPPANKALLRDY